MMGDRDTPLSSCAEKERLRFQRSQLPSRHRYDVLCRLQSRGDACGNPREIQSGLVTFRVLELRTTAATDPMAAGTDRHARWRRDAQWIPTWVV